jgi:hypothetical protein
MAYAFPQISGLNAPSATPSLQPANDAQVDARPELLRQNAIDPVAAAQPFAGLYDDDGPSQFDADNPHGPLSGDDVDHLMKEAPFAAQSTRYYHATRVRNLEKANGTGILQQGLDPNWGGTGAAKGNAEFEKNSKNKVHVTRNQEHGNDYKEFFETGVMPTNTDMKTNDVSPADLLKISLPKNMKDMLQPDPDDMLARTLDVKIPAENIKSSLPKPLPGPKEDDKEAEYQQAFLAHQARGDAENEALYSNMGAKEKEILDQFGPDQHATALQLLKQGMMATKNPMKRGNILP